MVIFRRNVTDFDPSNIEETIVIKLAKLDVESGTFSAGEGRDALVGEVSSPGIKMRGRYGWQAAVTDTGALRGCGGSDCLNPIEIDLRF